MPIYAYRCDSCGVRKDVLQKVSDAPLTECTACGAPAFHKELTAPAFQLKGSGWYVTDFRDKGKSTDKAGGEASAPAAGKSAETAGTEGAKSGSDKADPGKAAASAPAAPASTQAS